MRKNAPFEVIQGGPPAHVLSAEESAEIAAAFDLELQRLALLEGPLPRRARLALRLRRDKAPREQVEAAVRPILTAFMKTAFAKKEEIVHNDDGTVSLRPRRRRIKK